MCCNLRNGAMRSTDPHGWSRRYDYARVGLAFDAHEVMVIWSPASEQAADQQVRVSYMWLTSGATAGSVLARARV
jgi:hypothetical protein